MTMVDPAAGIYGDPSTQANFTPATNYDPSIQAKGGYYYQNPDGSGYTQWEPGQPLASGTQLYTWGTSNTSPSGQPAPTGGGTGGSTGSGSSGGGGSTGSNTPPPPDDTATINSANAILTSTLQGMGLGGMSSWATSLVTTLAGEGMDATDIENQIISNINNPLNADGSVNQQALDVFNSVLPGYNQRIANGFTNGAPGGGPGSGIAAYLSYQTQVEAMATTAGLTPQTITKEDIGNAWANDVSTSELSTRITTEYVNAANALPQIQAELQNYGYVQGLTTGQLASYYINPQNTVAQLQQQFNSAVAGGEGVLTGFGELGKSQAYALGAFLSNQGQNNLSDTQAAGFFTNNLGNGLNSLAGMEQAGFSTAQLGTAGANNPGVVSADQLIAAGEGNASAIQQVTRAAQTRAAPSQGGGGLAASQSGVEGVGFGSS